MLIVFYVLGGICGSPGLVGPSGSISSPSYPNSYGLNEYCRWAIAVSSAKKASITIPSLKTEKPGDRLEIRDGASKAIISVLAGVLPVPVTYTSGSNSLDVKFVSDGKSVGAVEGFQAQYEAVCKYNSFVSPILTENVIHPYRRWFLPLLITSFTITAYLHRCYIRHHY